MAEHILLTGAAGFIGSSLADRLLREGSRVTGIDNFDPFYDPAEKRANLADARASGRFELLEVDCADAEAVRRVVGERSFDAVVHLAAKAGVRPSIADPVGYARANVTATQVLLELSREREIPRFVFGSSSSVYGNTDRVPFTEDDPALHPISPYAATKRAGELLCRAHHHLHGGALLALRFFTVYGPRQRPDLAIRKFGTLMLRDEPIPMFGDGSTERDYTWIDDVLDGVTAAIARTRTHPSEFDILNLGGSRTTSLRELIRLIAGALGVEPRIRRLPEQPGDVERTFADVTRARNRLGYEPSVRVEEGIPRFVEWLETRHRA